MNNLYDILNTEIQKEGYEFSDVKTISIQLFHNELFRFSTTNITPDVENILKQIHCDNIEDFDILYDCKIGLNDCSHFSLEFDYDCVKQELVFHKTKSHANSNVDDFKTFVENLNGL